MTGFTPGPWEAVPEPDTHGEYTVIAGDEEVICRVLNEYCDDELQERFAADPECPLRPNAYMLAAAPDLYAALEECLREHGGFTIKGDCERKARAALSKARGEQS